MQASDVRYGRLVAVILTLLLCFCELVAGQQQPVRPLITQPVDEFRLSTLKGNTHPLARAEFDRGAAPASLPMERMLLVLKHSPEQETALRTLLDNQQDKHSTSYHKWLTPEQFGQQFGPGDQDVQIVTGWLQKHGFQVGPVAKGRSVIEFSGTAGQVQETFHTTIHEYLVHGEEHWANASDPRIPTALTPVVAGVHTLHNFLKRPQYRIANAGLPGKFTPGPHGQVTLSDGTKALGPADYATIYNINPSYNLGINGSGTTIAVIGRSNINLQDVTDFQTLFFGVPVNTPQVVLNGPDPGDIPGDDFEAMLDVTWTSSLATGATVDFVLSASTDTTDGVDLSEIYIIDNNLGNVMTESFSTCEYFATDSEVTSTELLAEQAAAQGITYMVSTGDAGATGCDNPNVETLAQFPVSVNLLASTPFTVAVGGTMFNENGQDSKYWGASPGDLSETALSYIPEDVWNESCTSAQCGASANIAAGGGGASLGNVANGGTFSGFSKPSWQTGVAGIPPDGKRDVPDVSLSAAGHDPYLLCFQASCENNLIYFVSGTSASAPSFAAVMSLVDQQMGLLNPPDGARQGQANYVLYRLAATETLSQCNGSSTSSLPNSTCTFNDVTVGNNAVPGEANYGLSNAQYQSTVGYDLATGLGSVNVANLVNNWNSVTFTPTTTTLALAPTTGISHGASVSVTIGVTRNSGSGTPTGDVSLIASSGQGIDRFTLASGSVSSTTQLLPGGTYSVTAHYAGDSTFGASDSTPVTVTVTAENSSTTFAISTFDPQTGVEIPYTVQPYGSPAYLRADVAGTSGKGSPTGSVTFNDTAGTVPGNPYILNSQGTATTATGLFTLGAGAHSVTALYGGDLSFQTSTSPAVNITVTQGPTTTAVVSNGGTLTATVSTSSAGNAPTGTVTFFVSGSQVGNPVNVVGTNGSGSVQSGSETLASATASITATVSGGQTVTATYNGDANYTASTTPPDFGISSSSQTVTVTSPGASGSVALIITSQAGFSGTVSFACSGLPSLSTCNAPSVNTSGTTTLTISTMAPHSAALGGSGWWMATGGVTFAGVFLLGVPSRRRRGSRLLSWLAFGFLLMIVGCGGGSSNAGGGGSSGTPTGTYPIVVTATSGSLTHTLPLTLTVQ